MDLATESGANVENQQPPHSISSHTSPLEDQNHSSEPSQQHVVMPPPVPSSHNPQSTANSESSAPDRPTVSLNANASHDDETHAIPSSTDQAQTIDSDAMDATPSTPQSGEPAQDQLINEQNDAMQLDQPTNSTSNENVTIDTGDQIQASSTQVEGTVATTTASEQPVQPQPAEDNSEESSPTSPDGSTNSTESTEQTAEGDDRENKPEEEEEPAYWADIEEDTSVPDEEELKYIASNDGDYSAYEYDYWEKVFYRDLDDPEYTPSEKARFTWKMKGIRGTKENPNRATIMRSPPAFIGGYYWTIKFFPRGNSVSSLSVYLECSRTPPEQDESILETEFKVIRGPPSATLSQLTPDTDIKLPATAASSKRNSKSIVLDPEQKKLETSEEADNEPTQSSQPDAEVAEEAPPKPDFRVSAQIGMVLYNPEEPRTGWMQSSCHQFNPHNLDWGWTHFHGPWDQIHRRQRGQRQALLRNDTLAFDAYIRIIDDPTQSLWWHSSDSEPTWDSLTLTGYRPIGDPMWRYNHEVAGIITWLLIAPVREIIQNVDVLEHLRNSNARPKPLCEALQQLLWSMRHQAPKPQLYVNTKRVTTALHDLGEFSGNVIDFWERFRRSIELELTGTDAAEKLSQIFDGQKAKDNFSTDENKLPFNTLPQEYNGRIRVPPTSSDSVQSAVTKHLEAQPGRWSLPSVLHVELARQEFDEKRRQWKMLFDPVRLDEELDLCGSVEEGQTGKYSLYGFIVHKGKRTSGTYYSVLRPGGPSTRWLAFKDATENKIECLTKKAALKGLQGLSQSKRKEKSSPDVAAVVVYIRNDMVSQYLPGKMEPWGFEVEQSYHSFLELAPTKSEGTDKSEKPNVRVEVFCLSEFSSVKNSAIDGHDLMAASTLAGTSRCLNLPATTTISQLRKEIASCVSVGGIDAAHENFRLWRFNYQHPSSYNTALDLLPLDKLDQTLVDFAPSVLRLWLDVLLDDQVKYFFLPDPKESSTPPKDQTDEITPTPETQDHVDNNPGPENTLQNEDVEMDEVTAEESAVPVDIQVEPALTPAANSSHYEQEEIPSEPVEPTASENPSPDQTRTNGMEIEPTTVNGNISAADETVIAEILARDLDELDRTQEMEIVEDNNDSASNIEANDIPEQNLESTNPPIVETVSSGDGNQNGEIPVSSATEDSQMEGSPIDESAHRSENNENETNETTIAEDETPTYPDLIEPSSHVYYFLQLFDEEKQEIHLCGAFFAKRNDNIKKTIRSALRWEEDKEFLLWHHLEGCFTRVVSPSDKFKNIVRSKHGERFLVGNVLTKARQNELIKAGSFSTPDRLLKYLWAKSRNHPIKAFTGTKTIEADINGEYYTGHFKNGYYHGKGTHISDCANTYIGDYVQGQRHGDGSLEYASGDTYSGEWVEDQPHGQGTYVEHKTGNKYVGGYRFGKRHGKGVSYWEVADEEMNLCQICYSEEQDALFYSCGHVCACVSCATQVDICPICREKVVNVVKIYRC